MTGRVGWGREPNFKLPLSRSVAMADALRDTPANNVSPLVVELHRKSAEARVARASGAEALQRVKFRADGFASRMEGLLQTGLSEIIVAAEDKTHPVVAKVCQDHLSKAGHSSSEYAGPVMAVSRAMKETFDAAVKALEEIHQAWGDGDIDTAEARANVKSICDRVLRMAQTALQFGSRVGTDNGGTLGLEARAGWSRLMSATEVMVSNFDRFERTTAVQAGSRSGLVPR